MNPKEHTLEIGKNTNSFVRAFRDPDDQSVHAYVGPLSIDWWQGLRHRPTVRWDRRGNWREA